MLAQIVLAVLWFLGSCDVSFSRPGPDYVCSSIVISYGYPCDRHEVQTEDGYLLALHHIPYSKARNDSLSTKPPVLLQHGLAQGGDDWLLNSPDQSLGFILADQGFDVWIGNSRASRWSSGHVSLTKQDERYWNWTWQDLAAYDVPALLEFIHNKTSSRVHFIGHSQGSNLGLVSFIEPSIRKFILSGALLAPVAYLKHVSSELIRAAVALRVDETIKKWEEFNPNNDAEDKLLQKLCSIISQGCENLIETVTGENCCFNHTRLPYYLLYEPHSTSTKNMVHYVQMVRTGLFRQFDYGGDGNLIQYGQREPPSYNVSSIPSDFRLFVAYGGTDALATVVDVKELSRDLRCNVTSIYIENYGHADFVYGTTAGYQLYNQLVSFLDG